MLIDYNMVKKKRRILEITEFRTKSPQEEEEMKKLTNTLNKFLEKQMGFEHQMLLKDGAKWVNAIQWRNIDYAKEGQKEARKSEECKEYFETINAKSIKSIYPELIKMY